MKKSRLKKILLTNPLVDEQALEAVAKAIEALRSSGMAVSGGYNLAQPYSKRVNDPSKGEEAGTLAHLRTKRRS